MVFAGSRSLNRVSFSPMLAWCPGASIVSAKLALCTHPVKRKTIDLSEVQYSFRGCWCQSLSNVLTIPFEINGIMGVSEAFKRKLRFFN